MKLRVGRVVAALMLLLALAGPPAQAQVPDPFARELARQLAQGETMLGQRGYVRVAGPFAGGLAPRLNRRVQITLRAGQDYEIIGVCDSRCRDIDMHLYDMADRQIDEDTLGDDVPTLQVRPQMTGLYTIEVVMYQCATPECFYAFNVYARQGGPK